MAHDRYPHPRPAELTAGFASLTIPDEERFITTIRDSETRLLLASHWYNETEHPYLLESSVWLERLNMDERTLHGQIVLDPFDRSRTSDALLVSLYQYLVIDHDQTDDATVVALRTDASERFEICIGTDEQALLRIRTETHEPRPEEQVRDAHQLNLTFRLSDTESLETIRTETLRFLRVWVAAQDCISALAYVGHEYDRPEIRMNAQSYYIETDELSVWQVLIKYEDDYKKLLGDLPALRMDSLDASAIAGILGSHDIDLLRQSLAMLAARKLEAFGATGLIEPIAQDEILGQLGVLIASEADE